MSNVPLQFAAGDYVYAIERTNPIALKNNTYTQATVINVDSYGIYTIRFNNGNIEIQPYWQLKIYFPCNCTVEKDEYNSSIYNEDCVYPLPSSAYNTSALEKLDDYISYYTN